MPNHKSQDSAHHELKMYSMSLGDEGTVDEGIVTLSGMDGAIIGTTIRESVEIAVYSEQKILDLLIYRDGMTREESRDYFDFNMVGSWIGTRTPVIVTLHADQ